MIVRLVLLLSFFSLALLGESKISTEVEAGVFLPTIDGSIENSSGSSDFRKDYVYDEATASYFALDVLFNYAYAPNVKFKYFYLQENSNSTFDRSVVVADGTFSAKVSTMTDFSVLNTIIYQDFKQKGRIFSILGHKFFTGDFEFDTGLNTKLLMWNFQIEDKTNVTVPPSWIHVQEWIPLPYLGFKYYLYGLTLYADVSALSFLKAKAIDYQLGTSYNVINGLSLSGGYVHEEFKTIEKEDTVKFSASGYKISFMYAF